MIAKQSLIILIGFMGSGKSAVGKLLAKKTGFGYLDLDRFIERKAKLKVAEIFEKYGEAHFRRLESEAVASLLHLKEAVVATGGGAILNPENLEIMKNAGLVVALDADPDTLWDRLKSSRNRPLLKSSKPRMRMEELYKERQHLYRQADYIIDTSGKTIESVADEIFSLFRKVENIIE